MSFFEYGIDRNMDDEKRRNMLKEAVENLSEHYETDFDYYLYVKYSEMLR